MKLTARTVPYSGVVGGGIQLVNEKGHAVFQIAMLGTTDGISKEQSGAISARLADLINEHGLEAPNK